MKQVLLNQHLWRSFFLFNFQKIQNLLVLIHIYLQFSSLLLLGNIMIWNMITSLLKSIATHCTTLQCFIFFSHKSIRMTQDCIYTLIIKMPCFGDPVSFSKSKGITIQYTRFNTKKRSRSLKFYFDVWTPKRLSNGKQVTIREIQSIENSYLF